MNARFVSLLIIATAVVFSASRGTIRAGEEEVRELLWSKECPECDLRGANLSGADLNGADIRGADLRGADLSGADLRHAEMAGICYDGDTQWPSWYTPAPSTCK